MHSNDDDVMFFIETRLFFFNVLEAKSVRKDHENVIIMAWEFKANKSPNLCCILQIKFATYVNGNNKIEQYLLKIGLYSILRRSGQ